MNKTKELKPRKALNKAFLKVKPNRTEIEGFKTNLITLLDRTNETESEEFHKNLVIDFLKKTYYDPNHFINTKGRNDLVIHNRQNANSTVGVILEAKKPTNKAEMISNQKLNTKAFQELVLYYLRERITHKNLEVKHLVATNINEWFIFDATLFDRLFAQNKTLVQQFNDFENGRLADIKTDFFYKQIAEPFINNITSEIEFTYFNILDYQKPLRNADKADDNSLIALFKLLSPEHLLKLPFTNDSNSLDKRFYSELLHIIGLAETKTKEGSKKLIERNKEGERHTGSILEGAIIQLDSLDKLSRFEKPSQFGNTQQERLFTIALELSITWINRILFLKLLEAQLITYHKGDKSYSFLNLEKIKNYDDLNSLFFQVLARKYEERNEDVKKLFEKVPYLNSSLFEPTDMEHQAFPISSLREKEIPIFSQTVLKDQQGKKRTGNLSTLQYLFEFLDAYDFGAEGGEEIQEDNKTLINASVLGLIFEKINGYKDGSFFTPGFITMYMCRETIRKAVIQKFNEAAKTIHLNATSKTPLLNAAAKTPLLNDDSKTPVLNAAAKTPLLRGAGGVSKKREIIPYNPKLKELARELRNNSTKSEIKLWQVLKGKFENKYDFHRQKPLDNYIVDFFCHELKLVIEVDGEMHNWQETQEKDFAKECRLNELGLNVLRFTDELVLNNLEAVLQTISSYIEGFEQSNLSAFQYEDTPLNPLSRGDFNTIDEFNSSIQNNNTPLNPLSRGDFKTLDEIYDSIGDGGIFTRQEANDIVNSIKICDPAVGSGHFLVSALNEMIAVKNDLKILQDRAGKRLKEYQVEVVNDELIVTDEEGELFEYTPPTPLERGEKRFTESQRVQETLFHEKQTIIENCLFGVDINSNSVKICRLRLWIELLKNAYYVHTPNPSQEGSYRELQTLPNIDINIKCGNSLVSRFAIDADLKQALKKSKWTIDSYKIAVDTYRNAESKEQKREMERLIADIKSDFRSEISSNDPKVLKFKKLSGDLFKLTNQQQLFEMSKKEKADWNKKVQQLTEETKKLETEIEEIKANKIFENAFEWRFEFPEVLNNDGDFVGFDVVIGNPPYVFARENFDEQYKNFYYENFKGIDYQVNLYVLFAELTLNILQQKGYYSLIVPNSLLMVSSTSKIRKLLFSNASITEVVNFLGESFEGVSVETVSYFGVKGKLIENIKVSIGEFGLIKFSHYKKTSTVLESPDLILNVFSNDKMDEFLNKIKANTEILDNLVEIKAGLQAYEVGKGNPMQTRDDVNNRIYDYDYKVDDKTLPYLEGKDVQRYFQGKHSSYLKYGDNLAAPRTFDIFSNPKIIIREITGQHPHSIISCYSDEIVLFNRSNIAINKKENLTIELKYILALINSRLISYYFQLNTAKAVRKLFPKIILNDLRKFPIKVISIEKQQGFIKLVDKIIEAKKQNPSTDTTYLENQIDQLVYQLYELTEEEIKIIENN